jgi:hypothetical protein
MNIGEEIILEVERRKRLANFYYDNFRKYYETKNFSKASEFLWGTLNSLVYAIGLFHRKKISKHREVVDFVVELANAYKDKEMGEGIIAAQRVHANFFHDFMDEPMFEDDKRKMEKLLEKLAKILNEKIRKLNKK